MKRRSAFVALFSVCCSGAPLVAQVAPPPTQAAEAEVVTLSPFEVSSAAPARYQSAAAAAGGRIAASIMDTPTTVTVLTSEFINDVGGSRVLDVAKYVAGVSEARIPGALDRVNIRGFESDGRRVDGFSSNDIANYDHGGIERLEVVKGPDALLHPSGPPGGTINLVTKKPQWTPGGSIKVQVGEYDTNRAEIDVTGPLGKSFAYRAVAALQDNEGYVRGLERNSFLFTPSLAWRITPQTNLTLRYEYYDFRVTDPVGIPTDPSVGTRTGFRVWEGLPLNFGPNYGKYSEYRRTVSNQGTLLFTSTITEKLSVRLAGRISEASVPAGDLRIRTRFETPVPDGWTSINPLTGEYEPGLLFDPNPPYAPIPAPPISPVLGLSGTERVSAHLRQRDVQNDWSYIVDADAVKSTTLIGFAYAYLGENIDSRQRFAPDLDTRLTSVPTGTVTPAAFLNRMNVRKQSRYQSYLTQQLEFFDERVILSGGVSHLSFNGMAGDKISAPKPPPTPTVAGQLFPGSGSTTTYNWGFVVKPTKTISLYYGHTENAVPVADYEQVSFGDAPVFSSGEQDEFGIKGNFFGGRVIASVAYYEIDQTGYSVFNPGNFATPIPPVPLPNIHVTRHAEGWEFQVTGSITPSLSVIASYTDATNRDPNGNMLAGAAEELANAYLRYEFLAGPLKGLAVALGANYASERAVENVTGYTPASTPDNLIPIRSSGFMPARTLVDATLSYSRGSWSCSLTCANALDKRYYAAADSRNLINIGTPRNVYGSVTWKF